jgi:hypothetical protein
MGERGVKQAIAICNTCAVRVRCTQYALNNEIHYGIWGGFTARGRRELANAIAYLKDSQRQEHKTTHWFKHYTATGDIDPIQRTAQTIGISKATVYHHLRIDRLARETAYEMANRDQN